MSEVKKKRRRFVFVFLIAVLCSLASCLYAADLPPIKSTALEASHVISVAPAALTSLHVYNSKSSAQTILIMDASSLPSNGAVTLLYPPIAIPAKGNVSLVFPVPLRASAGIVVANSSTDSFTLTIGSADCVFMGQVQ